MVAGVGMAREGEKENGGRFQSLGSEIRKRPREFSGRLLDFEIEKE